MANLTRPPFCQACNHEVPQYHQRSRCPECGTPIPTDRRTLTSRGNLGDHIPAPLGPGESRVITVRLPGSLADELDAEVARSGLTRSDIVRWCVEHALPESRKVPPYQPW